MLTIRNINGIIKQHIIINTWKTTTVTTPFTTHACTSSLIYGASYQRKSIRCDSIMCVIIMYCTTTLSPTPLHCLCICAAGWINHFSFIVCISLFCILFAFNSTRSLLYFHTLASRRWLACFLTAAFFLPPPPSLGRASMPALFWNTIRCPDCVCPHRICVCLCERCAMPSSSFI